MIIMDFHGFPTKRKHVLQQKWGKPSDEEVSGAKTDTLWLFNIAMENRWPIEIDGLPINSMVDLYHGYVSHKQMVPFDGLWSSKTCAFCAVLAVASETDR